jgi:hypothetical protein
LVGCPFFANNIGEQGTPMTEARIEVITRLIELACGVAADPASIGVLSTGEACAVALLLGRLDLLDDYYKHPLDALERLGPEWEKAVRDLHRSAEWRQLRDTHHSPQAHHGPGKRP